MKSSPTIEDAENWLKEQTLLLENQGAVAFELTAAQRLDAVKALDELKTAPEIYSQDPQRAPLFPRLSPLEAMAQYFKRCWELIRDTGGTLEEAAQFYAKHKAPKGERKTVDQVADEYIQDARDNNLRPRSIKSIEHRLNRFRAAFGDRLVCEITRHDVEKWVKSIDLTPISKKHFATVASGMYNYAIGHEYASENPFIGPKFRRDRHAQDEKLPECLPWKSVEKIMRVAKEQVPEMVPVIAVGFFAGLRTSEIQQLDWKSVDFASALITVLPETAKKRRTRHVTMEPNLRLWLLPYRRESGLVAPQGSTWRVAFDRVRELAGLYGKDEKGKCLWPENAMRHSFASYHLMKHNDAAKTALQLGHRNQSLLFDHYRALVKPQDAEAYWQLPSH